MEAQIDNQAMLDLLRGERAAMREQVVKLQEQLAMNKQKIIELQNKEGIVHLNIKEVEIADHAILRYCERILYINIEKIRKSLVTSPRLKELMKVAGYSGEFLIEDNVRVMLKDKMIITVLPKLKKKKMVQKWPALIKAYKWEGL